ncbi:MAG: DNA topoisomerase I, partial [Oscillospiraceae bacterium]|nr:DNA topoisomerase I [Oscillospiraceae bacterium]
MSNLVILESPSKAKTVKKYLGAGYEVMASTGHIIDLPKSKFGVDVDNNFEPQYVNMKDKADIIKELKKRAKDADIVYLATDPDREGEAIAWHLSHLLNIDEKSKVRVKFNEMTKTGVQYC